MDLIHAFQLAFLSFTSTLSDAGVELRLRHPHTPNTTLADPVDLANTTPVANTTLADSVDLPNTTLDILDATPNTTLANTTFVDLPNTTLDILAATPNTTFVDPVDLANTTLSNTTLANTTLSNTTLANTTPVANTTLSNTTLVANTTPVANTTLSNTTLVANTTLSNTTLVVHVEPEPETESETESVEVVEPVVQSRNGTLGMLLSANTTNTTPRSRHNATRPTPQKDHTGVVVLVCVIVAIVLLTGCIRYVRSLKERLLQKTRPVESYTPPAPSAPPVLPHPPQPDP